MASKKKFDTKKASKQLGKVISAFGDTISEILEDPELREKGKEFAQSVVDAAAKVVESRVKDDEVKAKFRDVGTAAQHLGQTLTEHFKSTD